MSILNVRKSSCPCGESCNCSPDCKCKNSEPIIIGGGIPLLAVRKGEKSTITKITGKDELRKHLSDMGFREGEHITTISETNGNMIVDIKGSRVAIDCSLARRISVAPQS